MKKDNPGQFLLVSQKEQSEQMKNNMDLRTWAAAKKLHIMQNNSNMLLDNRKRVYVLEMEPFNTKTVPKSSIRMLVCRIINICIFTQFETSVSIVSIHFQIPSRSFADNYKHCMNLSIERNIRTQSMN